MAAIKLNDKAREEARQSLHDMGFIQPEHRKYELKTNDGRSLGSVSYGAKNAIEREKLDSYVPKDDDEKRVIDAYKSYASTINSNTGTNTTSAATKKDGFVPWLGKQAMAGLSQFNKSIAATLDFILPTEFLGRYDFVSNINDYYSKQNNYRQEQAVKSSVSRGKGWDVGGEVVSGTIAALPNAILAYMTAGTSLGTQGLNTGLRSGAAVANAVTGNTTKQMLGNTVKTVVKNPMYWSSFLQTVGNDYEEAKENGANEFVASSTAILTSLLNAGVEIGGGIETLPQSVKNGGKKAVLEWVKSSLEEGSEEVVQGLITNSIAKMAYDSDRKVLNPTDSAKEFALGAAVGGVLGGAQTAVGAAVNRASFQKTGKIYNAPETASALIDQGLQSPEGTESREIAEKLDKRLSSGKKISNSDLGRLVYANELQISKENNSIEEKSTSDDAGVSVGDTFKDTKTGNKITVVKRDNENTTVEIGTGAKTEIRELSNSLAKDLVTNERYTPVTTNYGSTKNIALTQVGDSYEAYGADAMVLSEKLGLTPTTKDVNGERVAVVGFPVSVLENYKNALGNDYNVMVADDFNKNATEEKTEPRLTGSDAQVYSILTSNLKNAAYELGLMDTDFYDRLSEVNLYAPSVRDVALINSEFRRVFANTDDARIISWLNGLGNLQARLTSINEQNMPVSTENTPVNEDVTNIDVYMAEGEILSLKHTKNVYSLFKGADRVMVGKDIISDGFVAIPLTDEALAEVKKVAGDVIQETPNIELSKIYHKDNDVLIQGNPKTDKISVKKKVEKAYVFKIGDSFYICQQKYIDAFNNSKNVITANKKVGVPWTVHNENGELVALFLGASNAMNDERFNSLQSVSEIKTAEQQKKAENANKPFNQNEVRQLFDAGRPFFSTVHGLNYVSEGHIFVACNENAAEFIKNEYRKQNANSNYEIEYKDGFGGIVEKILSEATELEEAKDPISYSGASLNNRADNAYIVGDYAILFNKNFVNLIKKRSNTMKIISNGFLNSTILIGYDADGNITGFALPILAKGNVTTKDGKTIPFVSEADIKRLVKEAAANETKSDKSVIETLESVTEPTESVIKNTDSVMEVPENVVDTEETTPVGQLLEDYNDTVDNILSVSDETAKEFADKRVAVEVLKNTPTVILDNVEDARDLKVIINYNKLYLAVRKSGVFKGHYHNLGADIAKRLPEFLNTPDAIIQLANGRLNLFATVVTERGNNGIVSVELNNTKDINGKYEDYNVVVTMFSSDDKYAQNLISGDGVTEKYKREDLSQVNPQLYKWLAIINDKSSVDNIVSQNNDVVNNSVRTDTKNDASKVYDVAYFEKLGSDIRKGESVSLKDVRTAVDTILLNHGEAIKAELSQLKNDELKKHLSIYDRGRITKKAEMVDSIYTDMLSSLYYALSGKETITYVYDGTGFEAQQSKMLFDISRELTEETFNKRLAENAEKNKKQVAAREEKLAKVKNPQTLEDYSYKKRYFGLSDEETIQYENLYAEERRKAREEKKAAKTTKDTSGANAFFANTDNYTIEKTTHTKTGEDVWVVRPASRLETEQWKQLNEHMKALGGSYWRGNQGWNFKKEPTAVLSSTEESETETVKGSTNAKKLRAVAEGMQKAIDDKFRDRLTNTAKRAREAASAEAEGERLKRLQDTINNIADALENGENTLLDKIDSKAQVETLMSMLRTGRRNRISETMSGMSYDERTQEEGKPFTNDDVKYAEYPLTKLHESTITEYIRAAEGKTGYKQITDRLKKSLKSVKNGYVTVDTQMFADVDKIVQNLSTYRADFWNDGVAERKRLARMGIENVVELRAYLREFIKFLPGRNIEAEKQRVIKAKERQLANSKIEGFFPTPKAIVEKMLDEADIKPGEKVLEPSAGKGNIADAIRENYPDNALDVVEWNASLNELLSEKGHNVVGVDFLQHSGEYDKIIMNPPFEKGQDIDHIRHAYSLLNDGGRVVCIMSEGPFYRSDKKATEFREWLDSLGGVSEKLPEGAFKSSERSTGVNTRLVVIDKAASATKPTKSKSGVKSSRDTATESSRDSDVKTTKSSDVLLAIKNTIKPEIASNLKLMRMLSNKFGGDGMDGLVDEIVTRYNKRKTIGDFENLFIDGGKEIYNALRNREIENAKYSISERGAILNEQTGNDLLLGNSRRTGNESAGEQTRKFQDFKQKNQGKTESERKATTKKLLEKGQTQQKIIDITQSGKRGKIKLNIINTNAYTDDMISMAEAYANKGIDVIFYIGNGRVSFDMANDFLVNAFKLGSSKIYIRYDGIYAPQILGMHEAVHLDWNSEKTKAAADYILNSLTNEDKNSILSSERYKNYLHIHNGDTDAVWQEFVADALSGMNEYTADFAEVTDDYWYSNTEFIDSYKISEYADSIDAGGNETALDNIGFGNEYSLSNNRFNIPYNEKKQLEEYIISRNNSGYEIKTIDCKEIGNNFYIWENTGKVDYEILGVVEIEGNEDDIDFLRSEINGFNRGKKRISDMYQSFNGRNRNGDRGGFIDQDKLSNASNDQLSDKTSSRGETDGDRRRNTEKSTGDKSEGEVKFSISDNNSDFWNEWLRLAKEFGVIPKGENPTRDIDVPKKITKDKLVSRFARTMLEAGVTPETAVSEFERRILDGSMTHEVVTNDGARKWAIDQIKYHGFKEAMNTWNVYTRDNNIGKKELALGMELYNQCITNGDVTNAMKMAVELAAEATHAGQTLQATRMLKLMTPDGQLYFLEKSLKKMNDEFKKKIGDKYKDIEIDKDLMKKFLVEKNDNKRNKIYDDICQNIAGQIPATLIDKWDSWRYLAMLGNPRTHIRNIFGNIMFILPVKLKNYIGAAMESAAKISTSERTKSSRKSKKAVEFAKKDFTKMVKVLQGENAKYAITSDIESKRTIFKTKWLENLRNKNFEWLEKEDMWFLKMHYIDALARILTVRKIDLNNVNEKTLDNVRAYAVREAQRATYRDANSLAEALNKLQKKASHSDKKAIRATNVLLEGVMPFKKTPLNIAKQGVQYSPVGILSGVYKTVSKMKNGDAYSTTDIIDDFAKGLTGTAFMLLGTFLASLGLLSGGNDEDKKKKEFDKMVGEQSFSLNIGDNSYTIDWMTPLCLPLFTGVELYKLTADDFEFADIVNALSSLTDPLLELSVLSGVSGAIESAQYNDTNTLFAIGSDMTISYLMQALPTIGGQISRIIDKNKREYYYTDKNSSLPKVMQNFLGQISSKIPFASLLFEPAIDEWGREVSYGGLVERIFENVVSPGYYSGKNYTSVDEKIKQLYEKTGNAGVLPTIQQKSYTQDYVTYPMTAAQYTKVKSLRGKKSFEYLTELFNDELGLKFKDEETKEYQYKVYSEMSDEEKITAIKKCYKQAGEETKEIMFEEVKRNR